MNGSTEHFENIYCRDIFTENQCLSLFIVRTVFGIIGIFGALFLIFVIWVSNKLKRLFYRMLFCIAVINVIRNFVVVINIDGLYDRHPWCFIQGILLQFCTWAIISWELCLTVHLFLNSIKMEENENRERYYHIACWGASIFFALVPLVDLQYGHAITWCWVKDTGWRIGVLYAEYIIIIIIVFMLYGKVIYNVCSLKPPSYPPQPEEERRIEVYKKQVRPMIIYPFVILIEGIVPISFRLHNAFHGDEKPSFVFALVFSISVIFWGIPFVAVYVLDPMTRGEVLSLRVKVRAKMTTMRKHGVPNSHVANPRRKKRNSSKIMSVISIDPTTVATGAAEDMTSDDIKEREEVSSSATKSDSVIA